MDRVLAWMDRVLARIHLADEVKRIQQERQQTQQRLLVVPESEGE